MLPTNEDLMEYSEINDSDEHLRKVQEAKEKDVRNIDAIVETLTENFFEKNSESYQGLSTFEKEFMKSMFAAGIITGLKHAHGYE